MAIKHIWALYCVIGTLMGFGLMMADPIGNKYIEPAIILMMPFVAAVFVAINTCYIVAVPAVAACLIASIYVGSRAIDMETWSERFSCLAISAFLLLLGAGAIASRAIFDVIAFLCFFEIWGCLVIINYGGTYRLIECLEESGFRFKKSRIFLYNARNYLC